MTSTTVSSLDKKWYLEYNHPAMKQIIGERLKRNRENKGFTQRELAQSLGCTEVMISRYELGKVLPSIDRLAQISSILSIDISDFFNKEIVSPKMYRKEAFVFDLDDTLVDGRRFCGETIARVITKIDPKVDFNMIVELHDAIKGLAIEDLYKRITQEIGLKYDINELLNMDKEIQLNNIDKMRIFEGVVEVLGYLKNSGRKLYICTNRTKSLLDLVLDYNGIGKYFDEVISCNDLGYKKPNPFCLNDLVRRSHIRLEKFIYFGDSEIDADFARNAGIEFVIFDQYLNNKTLFRNLIDMFEN